MSMGIVSDEDILSELAGSKRKRTSRESHPEPKLERTEIRDQDSTSIPEGTTGPDTHADTDTGADTGPDSARKSLGASKYPSVVDIIRPGRKEGDVNVPESLRKLIAEEALLNGRQAAVSLAKDFGISPSSASAYAAGATSTTTYNQPAKSLIQHINKSRERAVKRAGRTLNGALQAITQEKLDYADVKDLAGIAKDMSVIIKNLEPREEPKENMGPASGGPQFVIYAPQFKQESAFETIVVKE